MSEQTDQLEDEGGERPGALMKPGEHALFCIPTDCGLREPLVVFRISLEEMLVLEKPVAGEGEVVTVSCIILLC